MLHIKCHINDNRRKGDVAVKSVHCNRISVTIVKIKLNNNNNNNNNNRRNANADLKQTFFTTANFVTLQARKPGF